jgi:hypothetical protein
MYVNAVLVKVSPSSADAGMGYKKRLFRKVGAEFAVDMQPYSPEMARKAYGLEDAGVVWRCFGSVRGLKAGDYVRVESGAVPKEKYVLLLVHEWEGHTELVLGVFKNG